MTYGEAHVAEQMSLELVDGIFVKTLHIDNKPKPLPPDEAYRYYNIKLFNHWINDYDYNKKASLKQKKELISAFMFGHKDAYKKYKELL